ncbi:MAG: dephospho-CoA kinase [Firmicutes bacterium]|mgnify:CR=1 FL=1|nr:dephospho-CoA kinase [Bacillota bacterium]
MKVIGLTGGIASGKSTVAGMLRAKGAPVLDADLIAREILAPGEEAWQEIVDWLGAKILTPRGAIDRRRLGELIFSDPKKRERLNRITHPRVEQELLRRTEKIEQENPGPWLVWEVPLLIEAGLHKKVDRVLLVYLPERIQRVRLQEREGLTAGQAGERIRAQMPLAEKRGYANYIIDNSGSREETAGQVERLWGLLAREQ